MAIAPAQLQHAWLGRVVFEPDFEFPFDEVANASYNLNPDVAISEITTDEKDGSRSAVVTLNGEIGFTRNDGTDGPTPFTLDIAVHGIFRWGPEELPPSDDLGRGWLEYNGMYLLWPYLRAYTATVTGLSLFPPLTIFTMNVPKPPVIPPPDDAESGAADEAPSTPAPSQSES